MSSKTKNTTKTNQTTTTSGSNASGGWNQRDVYDPAKAGLDGGLGMMQRWQSDPRSAQVYGGQRVADLSDATQQGMSGLLNNQGYAKSGQYLSNVLDGEYLNAGNPHLAALQQSITNSVMPGVNATFGRSGMTGATNHQYHLPKALGDAMSPHMFQNYENERNRQMAAAGQLPELYRQQAGDALRAGGIQDQQNQNVINADMFAFNEGRDRLMNVANAGFGNFLAAGQAFGRGNQGGWSTQDGTSNTTGTTTNTTQQSPFSQIMGAGMMGLGALTRMPGMMGMMGGGQMSPSMFMGSPMQAASQSAMMASPMSTLQNYNYAPPVIPSQVTQPYGQASYGYGGF